MNSKAGMEKAQNSGVKKELEYIKVLIRPFPRSGCYFSGFFRKPEIKNPNNPVNPVQKQFV
jgi:hypothetical protein